jgi:hypothetical protein
VRNLAVGLSTLVVCAAGCGSIRPQESSVEPAALMPGSGVLREPTLLEGPRAVAVSSRRAPGTTGGSDTTERDYAQLRLSEDVIGPSGDRWRLTRTWLPPYASIDSLVIERRTLRPLEETLSFGGAIRHYRFDGRRVTGAIQFADSAPRSYDHTFDEPLFAFNEVDLLARSLDYRPGRLLVVPLFSEVDQALERDTLSVIGQETIAGKRVWIVRFADPVITTRYVVDAASRQLVDAVTTQRRSGVAFHYAFSRAAVR